MSDAEYTTRRATFECSCGRELPATEGECDKCGAYWEPLGNGMLLQVAPPID